MPKITMEEYEEYPVLPPDTIINVKVDDLNVKDVQGQKGTWQKLEFTFKILGAPDEYATLIGSKIWGSVPFRFTESPDNKLRQWVEAILGMELSAGFELDTDVLVGRECRAIVSNYDKRSIDPRTGQPYKAHQVDSLLPRAGAAMSTPQQQPAMAATAPDPWAATSSSGGWSNDPAPF